MSSEHTRAEQVGIARKIGLDLLVVRARSRGELRTAMIRRNVAEEVADEVLDRFIEVGLLDDACFSTALAKTRSEVSLHGRYRILAELLAKGVDPEVAEEALAGIDPRDEREAALRFARRRLRSMGGLDPRVQRRRLAGSLARRGFAAEVIVPVLAEVLMEPVEYYPDEQ